MTSSKKSEIKTTQRDIELLGMRLDTMLRELATMVRVQNQQYAIRIDECRHAIKGQLTTPLNAVAMIEARERATDTAVNNG